MSHQLSLLPVPPPVRLDEVAVDDLHRAISRARRTTHHVGVRSADAARLCDWTGPLRQRYDAESAAVDRVAQDVEQALVHLGLTLGREVDRLRALRRRRPSALPW